MRGAGRGTSSCGPAPFRWSWPPWDWSWFSWGSYSARADAAGDHRRPAPDRIGTAQPLVEPSDGPAGLPLVLGGRRVDLASDRGGGPSDDEPEEDQDVALPLVRRSEPPDQ